MDIQTQTDVLMERQTDLESGGLLDRQTDRQMTGWTDTWDGFR